jgi:hypothetical protein
MDLSVIIVYTYSLNGAESHYVWFLTEALFPHTFVCVLNKERLKSVEYIHEASGPHSVVAGAKVLLHWSWYSHGTRWLSIRFLSQQYRVPNVAELTVQRSKFLLHVTSSLYICIYSTTAKNTV